MARKAVREIGTVQSMREERIKLSAVQGLASRERVWLFVAKIAERPLAWVRCCKVERVELKVSRIGLAC